ncbi:MAG: hypothetical protein KI792_12705 [Alphaproteobacteria bacterium]|nr:hypothetical protein [Alphaproteobacteria bacterium SS10]
MTGHGLPDNWRDYATAKQTQQLEAWDAYGTAREAAEALGVTHPALSKAKSAVAKKMRLAGQRLDEQKAGIVGDPMAVKRQSGFYKIDPATGEAKLSHFWQIAEKDREAHNKALVEAFEELCQDLPRATLIAEPGHTDDQILCKYPIADLHMGLRTYFEETGEDWDTQKAGKLIRAAMNHLVDGAPPAETAVIVQLGDHFDADDHKNRTPLSGNLLDPDGSRHRILWAGFKALQDCIDLALQKHKRVIVISLFGNHDINAAVALQIMLSIRYENEPRVTVEDSAMQHRYSEFGVNLFGYHHGDGVKPKELPATMAADMAEAWGRTKHRECHSAHRHHLHVEDVKGTLVFMHPIISASSKYSANAYRSQRMAWRLDYSKTGGPIGDQKVTAGLLYTLAGVEPPPVRQPLALAPAAE